jgi:hypothetical protein
MSIVTYNNRSIANISAVPGATKALTHIKTLTASSSSTLSFVDGSSDVVLDSTYPIYLFKFINIHSSSDGEHFLINFRDGGSNYDATKTNTVIYAYHDEADSETGVIYSSGGDIAQSTAGSRLGGNLGVDNDHCCSGEVYLFNPSNTTFVKHFISSSSVYSRGSYNYNWNTAGYCNVTAAIDAVQFSMSSGDIDAGTIKLYGLKDS